MLGTLLNLFENYKDTCSIDAPRSGCVSFVRTAKYLNKLIDVDEDMWVIVPEDIELPHKDKMKWYRTDDPDLVFTLYHNKIHENTPPKEVIVGKNCDIHDTVVMNVKGLKAVNLPNGIKIPFKHTGGIIIGDSVEIGPYSVVHRGSMSDTVIGDGCRFGSYTNIAHNCRVGKNTVMAAGVITNGGAVIGENCWISSGANIKNYTTICDNVVVGLSATVTKDITKAGIYTGTPARFMKPVPEGWNF